MFSIMFYEILELNDVTSMKDMLMKYIELVGAKLLRRNVKYGTMVDKLSSVTKMVTIGKPMKKALREVVAISNLELPLHQGGDMWLEDAKEKEHQ